MIRRFLFEILYLIRRTPWDTGISPPELMYFLDNHQPGRAIDLGCGTGTNVINMAKRGWQVTGVDISRHAINQAQRKARAARVNPTLHQEDVIRLSSVSGQFDLALDIGCFHSLPQEDRSLYAATVSRIVNPGGTYLLYTWLAGDANAGSRSLTKDTIMSYFCHDFELSFFEEGTDRHRTSAWFSFRRKP
jgi:cyclopropane fatty-acyl-phospholipid synthase-like methyltransferase